MVGLRLGFRAEFVSLALVQAGQGGAADAVFFWCADLREAHQAVPEAFAVDALVCV